jgi:amidase
MTRRLMVTIVGICLAWSAALPAQRTPPADLDEATIADLQQRMASGRETSRSIVDKYLARIAAFDRSGPELRSVLEINPDARATADRLDAERRSKGPRGPLHGVPIVIKDNIATADRMMTTAGSLALEGVRPPKDAAIVDQLRAAGAVILGKTNLSEWANFRSTRSSSGWSGRGGQTKNPYALDRNPSGSSSGSAVAVAANLAAAAIGTETDGSIVSPSSANALVGIKPTVGLVSRTGIVPIAHSQDTAGPMTRTVADAAALLSALVQVDSADPAMQDPARKAPGDYARALDRDGLRGARIGVVRAFFGHHPEADQLANQALDAMRRGGAVIVDPVKIPTLGQFDDSELDVLLYEFKADLNQYLSALGPASRVHSLADVIAFNSAHRDEELRHFGQELFQMAQRKDGLESAGYKAALAKNRRLSGPLGIDAVMTEHKLDALVGPTGGLPWLIDLVNGDRMGGSRPSPSSMAAVAGYPHVTVPMGFFDGLPVGLSFVGRAWSEATLIRLAYAYEQATKLRRPPTFAPTATIVPR